MSTFVEIYSNQIQMKSLQSEGLLSAAVVCSNEVIG